MANHESEGFLRRDDGIAMDDYLSVLVTGAVGFLTGTLGSFFLNQHLEKQRQYLSTKREQLKSVFGPLEVLAKMNRGEFDRYMNPGTSAQHREFIEQRVWFPNLSEIRRVLMEHSHLLDEIPSPLLKLLTHINVWLAEYDLIYVKKLKPPPVFAGPEGYPYPTESDTFIYARASELRKLLNK
jgi:hypothetical protein